MFIIRVLFYLLDGIMDSSFLTGLHLVLSFCSIFVFLKQLRVFGISNEGFKVISHLSSGSLMAYSLMLSWFDLGVIDAWDWQRFHVIPMVIFASSILIQLVMLVGGRNYNLHKTLTRIPILLALVVMSWGGQWVNQITLVLFILTLIMVLMMKGHRQQRRTLVKMYLFLFISIIVSFWSLFWGELFLLAVIFYFSIFQNTFCIESLLRKQEVSE